MITWIYANELFIETVTILFALFQIQHCVNNPYLRILNHSNITQKTKYMAY